MGVVVQQHCMIIQDAGMISEDPRVLVHDAGQFVQHARLGVGDG
jgi:hypothetical protein